MELQQLTNSSQKFFRQKDTCEKKPSTPLTLGLGSTRTLPLPLKSHFSYRNQVPLWYEDAFTKEILSEILVRKTEAYNSSQNKARFHTFDTQ
jgi:hypothetical protein